MLGDFSTLLHLPGVRIADIVSMHKDTPEPGFLDDYHHCLHVTTQFRPVSSLSITEIPKKKTPAFAGAI